MFLSGALNSYFLATLCFIFVADTMSLSCYQTNKGTKGAEIVENENFEFCSIFPSLAGASQFETSSSDGLTIDELDIPFGKFFEENDNIYNMLSVCLYEKYEWPKVMSPKFHKSQTIPQVEYTLRCVCNYDLCNHPNSFSAYINQLDK